MKGESGDSAFLNNPEYLKIVLHSIGDAVVATDTKGKVTLLNPVAEKLTGWRENDALGQPIEMVFRIENAISGKKVKNPVADVLRSGKIRGLTNNTRLLSKNGDSFIISDKVTPILNDTGDINGVVIVFRDEGERYFRQQVQALRLTLFDYAADHSLQKLLIKALDETEIITHSKLVFFYFVEADQETLSLQACSTRTLKDYCKAKEELHKPVRQSGILSDALRLRKAVIHNNYAPLNNKKGLPEGHASVIRELVAPVFRNGKVVALLRVGNKASDYNESDAENLSAIADICWAIPEKKRIEEELDAKQNELQTILDASPTMIFYKDLEGRHIFSNKALADALGKKKEEILGTTVFDLFPEYQAKKMYNDDLQVLNTGKALINSEEKYETPAGTRWTRISKIPLVNQKGERIGLIGFANDITEQKKTEEELKNSEERFRKAFMTSPDAITLSRLSDGRYVEINEGFIRLSEFKEEEVIGKSSLELNIWKNAKDREYLVKELQKEGIVANFEASFRAKDGSIKIGLLSASVLTLNGEAHLLSITRDITESKKAEEKLKESERNFRLLFENSPLGTYIAKANGSILNVNQAALKILGSPSEEATRQINVLQFPPLQLNGYSGLFKICVKTGEIQFMETLYKSKWNREAYLSNYLIPLKDEAGKVKRIYTLMQDITDRKKAEDSLRDSERKLKIITDSARDAIIMIDSEGSISFWNPSAEKMFGYSLDEAMGKELHSLIAPKKYHSEYQRAFAGFRKNSTGKIIGKTIELSAINKEGNEFPIEISLSAIKLDDLWGAVAVVRDITKRKKAEMEKDKLQQQLIQAQKMESVGRLAGGVAHDFNNMLTIIQGNVELAKMQISEEHPLWPYLSEIQQTARRSADLTRQLLAFARKQTAEPRLIDLNTAVASMLKMLRRLIGEDIDLQWRPTKNLDKVLIDPVQVDQILANLCVNARDAIGQEHTGNLTIETDIAVFDQAYCNTHPGFRTGEFAVLSISDDGAGMDKKTLSHIFEPFFTTKSLHSGTGLGLATVYGIVKQNKGFINVYSEPDMGTTFKIYLPLQTDNNTQHLTASQTRKPIQGKESILVIDDEAMLLKMTTKMLEMLGYHVITAKTPSEALKIVHSLHGHIDVLLTDLVMPKMNGRELAEKIHGFFPNIKILFMSGYPANVISHEGILERNTAFLHKPFSIRELSVKLREVLDAE